MHHTHTLNFLCSNNKNKDVFNRKNKCKLAKLKHIKRILFFIRIFQQKATTTNANHFSLNKMILFYLDYDERNYKTNYEIFQRIFHLGIILTGKRKKNSPKYIHIV